MVSCHLTEPNYKTTQPCAHSWGAWPPVTRGKIDDVSVTRGVETHPDITALLSAHVEEGDTGPLRHMQTSNNGHVYKHTGANYMHLSDLICDQFNYQQATGRVSVQMSAQEEYLRSSTVCWGGNVHLI